MRALAANGGKGLATVMRDAPSPCVPYLGICLGILINANELPSMLPANHSDGATNGRTTASTASASSTTSSGNDEEPQSQSQSQPFERLVNFSKCRQIGDVIANIETYQRVPYLLEVHLHLQRQLHSPIDPSLTDSDTCYGRSLELEPRVQRTPT